MSIAHLDDAQRMFFVTILLNEILAWIRTQPGTSSLRAMLYMDEVFGYFPPTGNPPAKRPMLTLLKQARAFGLGCVLATQNPVDLDYKGLSNAGTWFLGRLQTERDKARVIEGLEGASAQAGSTFNRQEMEATLAALGNRVFLMNNVHDDAPVVFESRWAMSYLVRAAHEESNQNADGPGAIEASVGVRPRRPPNRPAGAAASGGAAAAKPRSASCSGIEQSPRRAGRHSAKSFSRSPTACPMATDLEYRPGLLARAKCISSTRPTASMCGAMCSCCSRSNRRRPTTSGKARRSTPQAPATEDTARLAGPVRRTAGRAVPRQELHRSSRGN